VSGQQEEVAMLILSRSIYLANIFETFLGEEKTVDVSAGVGSGNMGSNFPMVHIILFSATHFVQENASLLT
jgi:hypothetical protein